MSSKTNSFFRVIHIVVLVAVVSGASGSNSKQSANTTLIFNEINKDSRDYFKIISNIFSNRQHSVLGVLDEIRNKNERQQLVDILNANPQSVIAAFVPFIKREANVRRNILKAEPPLKDLQTCSEDIETFIAAAQETLTWALRMLDAAGKPSSGILDRNVRFLGDFDECINTETGQRFRTKYCLTTVIITRINQINFTKPLGGQIGLCMPDSCDDDSLTIALNMLLTARFGNGSIIAAQSQCQERSLPLTDEAKAVIAVLSVIAFLLAIGTLYDILFEQGWWSRMLDGGDDGYLLISGHQKSKQQESSPRSEYEPLVSKDSEPTQSTLGRLLLSFSIYHNTTKLLSTTPTSGTIDCINGIRFISMTWVVLGHSIIYGLSMMANIQPYLDISYGRWTFQVISNALVAVDTFFTLSGLLLVYLVLKGLEKTGPSAGFFGQLYFHRFWRLTPPYMFVLMAYVPLNKYLSDGPTWPQNDEGIDECKDSWWTNLLYINNFVRADKMCMGWSWYLSNDMQFFIISPLLFLPMFYLGGLGLVIPFVFLLGNAMASGILTYMNDLSPILELSGGGTNDYFKMYYIKPYTRMGPYIVGMVTGYLLYKYGHKVRLPKPVVVIAWILATAMALAVQYGMFQHTNGHPVTSEVAALYNALHRITWAVSVCWVIFACANGYGGFVNTLLSWKALTPLSRLTYCVYLVHPIIITFHYASQRTLINMDNNNVVFSFLGILVMSYLVGYAASMAFEAPMIGMEKALKKKKV